MSEEDFIDEVESKGYPVKKGSGNFIVVGTYHPGYIDLRDLESIPPDVKFVNYGGVNLNGIKELPKGTIFNNDGNVTLRGCDKITRGTRFGIYVEGVWTAKGFLHFDIPGINFGRLLTAMFKYL
jgi:hypothetical protein